MHKTDHTTGQEGAALSLIVLRLVQHLLYTGVLTADAARDTFGEAARACRAASTEDGAVLAESLLSKLEVGNV